MNLCRPELSLVRDNSPLWPQLSLAGKIIYGLLLTVILFIAILVLLWKNGHGLMEATLIRIPALLCFAILSNRLFGHEKPGVEHHREPMACEEYSAADRGEYEIVSEEYPEQGHVSL